MVMWRGCSVAVEGQVKACQPKEEEEEKEKRKEKRRVGG
jgi:hypothetical protein